MDQATRRQRAGGLSPTWGRVLALCSVLALLGVLAARVGGPSDAWDQTQPKTIACTADIIVNGNWVLPRMWGTEPATKPPLYNWLAVPMVGLMGLASEPAHKSPSLLAICLCWLVTVRLGRRIDPGNGGELGWLAGICLVANYSFFKLGYLARPDMLLALWLLVGWIACTTIFIGARAPGDEGRLTKPAGRPALALCFWLCLGLAALTKGPGALPLLAYAVVAARFIGGRWRAFGVLQPWWGLPLALLIFGAWAWAVWRIDPDHLRQLWLTEVAGRVVGVGPQGSHLGPVGMLTTAPYMPLYYLGFFFPWSLLSILAAVSLWSKAAAGGQRRWRTLGPGGAMLHGAAIFVIVTLALYTLSASKRADYGSVAYAPGALLAAWWLLRVPPRLGSTVPWLAPVGAALVLAVHTIVGELEPNAPYRGLGDAMSSFSRDAETHLRAAPAPVVFWASQHALPQAYFGADGHHGVAAVRRMLTGRRPFWLFAGRRREPPLTVLDWLPQRRPRWTLTEACRSRRFGPCGVWPEQMVLYRVDPPPR
jgi:4-amino-4-deoxy-L-arabinose transferase-like glycosyltransferase